MNSRTIKTHHTMKKKIITIAVALMLTSAPSMAQIFLSDEEQIGNDRLGTSSFDVDLPGLYNSGHDWFTPLGSGSLLLAGLAGAYFVSKRKKQSKE
jgi:hypothetical protein